MEDESKNSEDGIIALTLEQIRALLEDKDTCSIAELYVRGKLKECIGLGEETLQKDFRKAKRS